MPQLAPSESFPIVRVLQLHTDTDTNYVQASIRDATTDAVLETLNLDDKGNRRFHKVWKVPYTNTFARGKFILITTTVFTDSGYTTKNPNYAEVGDTYLIAERFNNHGQFGGGGVDIDYKEIRKIIKEEMVKLPDPVEPPKPIDLTPQLKELNASMIQIGEKIDDIPVPEKQKMTDLTPLVKGIENVIKEIKALPRFKETDMSPVAEAIRDIRSSMTKAHDKYLEMMTSHIDKSIEEVIKPTMGDNEQLRSLLAVGLGVSPEIEMDTKRNTRMKGLAMKHGIS